MRDLKSEVRNSAIGRRGFMKLGAGAGAMIAATFDRLAAQTASGQPASIDLHAHWAPLTYSKAVAELRPGTPAGNPNPLEFDLEARCKWMDQHGIAMHALTLSGAMPWQWVDSAAGAHLAHIINDAAVEAHTAFPDRFVAGIELSIRSPELALQELNRVAGKPGLRAVHLPDSIEGRDYIFEPEYATLLARCEELGYPLIFHPLDGEANYYGGKERLGGPLAASTNINNTLGFPFDTATLATKFIVTGALDKFPKLEIVLPHSGGCFPYVAGRVETGLAKRNFKLQRPFREYIRRFHYDTLAYYPETLRFMIDLVGSDRVVIGSDDYAGMSVEYPNALVEGLSLPIEDRDRILKDNAARLLRL